MKLGLAHGETPRLVLVHPASPAARTGSPVVHVGDATTAFARLLGRATGGPPLSRLEGQLARPAAAPGRMDLGADGRAVRMNTQIVVACDRWFPADLGPPTLWRPTVRLSTDSVTSPKSHAGPLDRRAVGAPAGSSLDVGARRPPDGPAVGRRPGPDPRTQPAAGDGNFGPSTARLTGHPAGIDRKPSQDARKEVAR